MYLHRQKLVEGNRRAPSDTVSCNPLDDDLLEYSGNRSCNLDERRRQSQCKAIGMCASEGKRGRKDAVAATQRANTHIQSVDHRFPGSDEWPMNASARASTHRRVAKYNKDSSNWTVKVHNDEACNETV